MVSTVRSRPNHYELLGLSPTASQEEIARAFAQAMGMFGTRPLAVAAHISHAFEVLRNPAKRNAYDRSLGLIAEPQPRQWTLVARQRWTPFIASAAPNDSVQAAVDVEQPPEPHVTLGPKPDAVIDPKLAALTASLRELAKPVAEGVSSSSPEEPAPQPQPQPHPRPEPRPDRHVEQDVRQILAEDVVQESGSHGREARFPDWRYPAFALGSLIAIAGLLGGWAGLWVTHNGELEQGEPAVTVTLPKATKRADLAAALPAPVPTQAGTFVESPVRTASIRSKSRRSALQPEPTLLAAPQAVETAGQTEPAETGRDPLAPEPAAQPVAASPPLPNRVIASTIERIGYSCGEVASASAVEGASGVFKVTCSSGQTYQATPVRGRYHFRRSE